MKQIAVVLLAFAVGFAVCWVIRDARTDTVGHKPQQDDPSWPLNHRVAVHVLDPAVDKSEHLTMRVSAILPTEPGAKGESAPPPPGDARLTWTIRFPTKAYILIQEK